MSADLVEFMAFPPEFQEFSRMTMLKESKKKTKADIKSGHGYVEESCRACRKRWIEDRFNTCNICNRARYCSEECQMADRPDHSIVCTPLPALFANLVPLLNGNIPYQSALRFAFIHQFQLTKKRLPEYASGHNLSDIRPRAPPLMILNVDVVLQPSSRGIITHGPGTGEMELIPQLRNLHFPPPSPMPFQRYEGLKKVLIAASKGIEARKPTRTDESPDSVAFMGILALYLHSSIDKPVIHPIVIFQSALDEYALGQAGSTLCMILTGSAPESYSTEHAQSFINRVFRDDVGDYFCLRRRVPYMRFKELDDIMKKEGTERLARISEEKKTSDMEMGMQIVSCWSQRVFSDQD